VFIRVYLSRRSSAKADPWLNTSAPQLRALRDSVVKILSHISRAIILNSSSASRPLKREQRRREILCSEPRWNQDGPVKFEKILQGELADEADRTAVVEPSFKDFVFDQGFANVPDPDIGVFHLPDLAGLELLDGDARLLRRVIHWDEYSRRKGF